MSESLRYRPSVKPRCSFVPVRNRAVGALYENSIISQVEQCCFLEKLGCLLLQCSRSLADSVFQLGMRLSKLLFRALALDHRAPGDLSQKHHKSGKKQKTQQTENLCGTLEREGTVRRQKPVPDSNADDRDCQDGGPHSAIPRRECNRRPRGLIRILCAKKRIKHLAEQERSDACKRAKSIGRGGFFQYPHNRSSARAEPGVTPSHQDTLPMPTKDIVQFYC